MKLEARGVGKQHLNRQRGSSGGPECWLLRDVNLSIASGDIVGLEGISGSGKSTLCRMLAGIETMDQGEIFLNDQSISSVGRNRYHPVQLVFQHPEKAVNPRWRVKQILEEGWMPDQELLRMLDIQSQWLERYPSELSGGQLQRICIARALSPQTQFLLADEMTTMLDAITQSQVWRVILEIVQERNIGLLVVSHDRHLLKRICSHVMAL